jgi:PucR family transcriptional regulator, purine catabolism regulatory protein
MSVVDNLGRDLHVFGEVTMPTTLRTLVDASDLGLVVRSGSNFLDRPVNWVHVSELEDPTPFLEGGELLLTTGLALRRGTSAQMEYVARLTATRVAGLGFGTGLTHDQLPEPLVAAAEHAGLPLIEVPLATPFIAISKAVSRAAAADQYAGVTRIYEAHQQLTNAAVRPDSFGSLIQRLARLINGWALLLDRGGGVMHAAPTTAGQREASLVAEVDRLRGTRAPASAAIHNGAGETVVQSLSSGRGVLGFLAAGREHGISVVERQIINVAASLLTFGLDQSRVLEAARRHLRTGTLRLLLAGERDIATLPARDLWGDLPAEPLRLVVIAGAEDVQARAADLLETEVPLCDTTVVHADIGDAVVAVVHDGGEGLEWFTTVPRRMPGVHVGISDATNYVDLPMAFRQATRSAEVGRQTGQEVTRFSEVAVPGLLRLVALEHGQAFTDSLLGPLEQHDAAGRGNLIASLTVWLANHGQWDPSATQLGIHRHTLRHRLRKVEQLLGRSLNSADVRAELWLALRLREREADESSSR